MKLIRSTLVALSGAGLMVSQPVLAQQPGSFEESIGAPQGSGPIIFIGLLATLLILANLAFEDDGNTPVSP